MKRRDFLAVGTLSVVGLSGCLGDTEYRLTEITAEDSAGPLSVSGRLAVTDATIEHPAELVLTLENTGDETVRVRSYGVWPFGVLAVASSPTPDDETWKTTLFSPSYEATDRVETSRGGGSMSMDGTPITKRLGVGETVSRRYELRGDDLSRAGTYYVVERFDGRASQFQTDTDWEMLDYRLRVEIEQKTRVPLQQR